MSRRKKKVHDEHIDESWLVPYADILTLLLALFIVLFSSSSVDANKFQQMSNVFSEIFTSGNGVMENPSPAKDITPSETEEIHDSEIAKALKNFNVGEQEELREIQQKVNNYIESNNLGDKLDTALTSEGLLLTIRDNVLFESGSAEVREKDKEVATEISELLVMDPVRSIVISGHTDNVPIQTAQYETNWDLSVMRAVNFMKVLLENSKLNQEWFSAQGYGEFKPVAPNDTPEGRAKNRRVEILIVPRTSVDETN